MTGAYTADGVVVAYTGERGEKQFGQDLVGNPNGVDLYGFKNSAGSDFQLSGNYTGGGKPSFLYYDGHTGIDFRTTDQSANGQLEVLAAAAGTVQWIAGSRYNTLVVDHGNGYRSHYLHLSQRIAPAGSHVDAGDVVGVSGEEGSPGAPHLHYEVQHYVNGQWIPVDPYGWQGSETDPYVSLRGVANDSLWLTTTTENQAYNSTFLTDAELEDSNSLTTDQIRTFLTDHNSYFRQPVPDVDGTTVDLPEVITQAATQSGINPKVLLTTLQKESVGVTTSTRPSDTRMALLMGAGSQSTARKQVLEAARLLRVYQDELTNSGISSGGWKVGVARSTLDDVTVTPATKAIAGQFTYTPYAGAQWGGSDPRWGGVFLFYNYWRRFGFSTPTPLLDVTLASVTPSPSTLATTETLELTFSVNSTASANVLLGASLQVPGGSQRYDMEYGPGAPLSIGAGTNNVRRTYTLPAGIPAGTYDISAIVWRDLNGNGVIDFDQELSRRLVPSGVTLTPDVQNGVAAFIRPTDTIVVPGHTAMTTAMTIEARFQIALDAPDDILGAIFSEQRDGQTDKSLRIGPNGLFGTAWTGTSAPFGGFDDPGITATLNISKGEWHHAAFVRDAGFQRLYLDGVLVQTRDIRSGAFAGGIGNSDTSIMSVGGFQYTGLPINSVPAISGSIDWIRVSGSGRYSGTTAPPPTAAPASDSSTLLLYDFSDPSDSTTVRDQSSNNWTGTLGVGFDGATAPQLTGNQDHDIRRYHAVDLGTLGGANSGAGDINDAGQVTGFASTPDDHIHAFLYSGEVMGDLGALNGQNSFGYGINDVGEVVGIAENANAHNPPESGTAFLWRRGTMSTVNTPYSRATVYSINDAGQIPGATWSGGQQYNGFIWQNGATTILPELSNHTTLGLDINNAGTIVGYSNDFDRVPVMWLEGGTRLVQLPGLDGIRSGVASGINNLNQAVGGSNSAAVLWDNNTVTRLGSLGGTWSTAYEINDVGQAVGTGEARDGSQHAFVYTSGRMFDLNDLVDDTSGFVLFTATAISNSGQIVATGVRDGIWHAFLISPGGWSASIAAHHVFYNSSAFDGSDPAADAQDDDAIASDKVALLGIQPATAANLTTYSRGINGIMIDIAGLPAGAALTADDFVVRVGTVGNSGSWALGPTPSMISIRRGAGDNGSDRVTLTWPDGVIKNTWLQILVKPSARTGLQSPDVFTFGSLIGDTGDGATNFRVNALDLGAVKRALNASSTLTGRFDFNRDGRVNALDLGIVKANLNRSLATIAAAAPTPASPFLSASPAANLAGEASVRRVWDEPAAGLWG